jgi:demethylmenaquinone methyltransferase/2-methoxy-6-polyprenyl-1,4-benzoquinol methylase
MTAVHNVPPSAPSAGHDEGRARQVQTMFGRIVGRYDVMNRLMSFGMDGRWRRAAASAARPAGARVLDLGSGTGDLSRELVRSGASLVVGGDFTRDMVVAAARRYAGRRAYAWTVADVLHLPFADATFDAVTNGFLLRNVVDLPAGIAEMARVLRPGGRLVCLDMTHVPDGPFAAPYRFYFHRVMPQVAGILSGDRAAYRYLSNSLTGYPDADGLARILRDAGLRDVAFRRLGFASVALHAAIK